MSLSLSTLRLMLRTAGRNTNDPSYYKTIFLDECINRLCARFLRETSCVKVSTTIDFDATTNEADFSGLDNFLSGRIERARIIEDANYTDITADLEIVPADDVLDAINQGGIEPADDGTLSVTYASLQSPFDLGAMGTYSTSNTYVSGDLIFSNSQSKRYRAKIDNTNIAVTDTATWEELGAETVLSPGSISTVIPDGLMIELIGTGGPPMLQAVDREQTAFTGPAWQSYLEFEQRSMGIGSISGKSSRRDSLRDNSLRDGCRKRYLMGFIDSTTAKLVAPNGW